MLVHLHRLPLRTAKAHSIVAAIHQQRCQRLLSLLVEGPNQWSTVKHDLWLNESETERHGLPLWAGLLMRCRDDADGEDRLLLQQYYDQNGYISVGNVLDRDQVTTVLDELARYESVMGTPLTGDARFKTHLLLPRVWELVHHLVIVSIVQKCLGTEDVWCWSTDWNIKEPLSRTFFAWHQDSTYAGMDPPLAACTVWLALTPSTPATGCVRCIPGSHRAGQLPHEQGMGGNDNALALGQACAVDPNWAVPQDLVLQPGDISVHSFLTAHASSPNNSHTRRVGLALRYVAAWATKTGLKESATLVAGQGRDLFDPEPEPKKALGEEERAAHQAALAREKANYLPPGAEYS